MNHARLLGVNLVDHVYFRADLRECVQVKSAIFCVLSGIKLGILSRGMIYRDSISKEFRVDMH